MRAIPAIIAVTLLTTGLSAEASAETRVTLKKMHICCGACVKGIEKAVKDLDGVTVKVSQKDKTTVVTGKSDDAVQKAIDKIADGGYHAESDHKSLKMKDDSGAKEGKSKRVELTGVHNCCGGCNKAVKKAIKTVDGVDADTAKAKSDSFVVEGNFDTKSLIKALNDAGFHVKIKK